MQGATFNGQFNNDLEIEFAYGHSSYGTVRFNFYDKDNPNQIVFTIYRSFGIGRADKIEQGIVETTWGSAFVEYNGKFFALGQEFSNATDAVLYCQDQNISFYPVNNAKATDPHSFYTDKWNIPGKLILNWMGNSVEIKATIGEGDTVTGLQTLAILSLPDFKDGYTIKMTGQGYDSVHESEESILILGINGVRFDKEYTETSFYSDGLQYSSYMNQDGDIYVAKNGELGEFWCQKYYEYFTPRWQKSVIEDEEFIEEGFSVEYNVDLTSTGEKQVVVTPYLYGISGNPKIFTIIVEESAKIVFDCNGGVAIKDLYYSEHTFDFNLPFANKQDWKFGGWYNDGVLFEGFETFSSLTDITLKAHWYDNVGPEINLVDTVTEVLKVTEELQELAISSADVTVYDAATNKLFTEEEITVTIKVPGSNDYILLSDFVFDCKLYGTYFIKYSASDNWTSLGNIVNNANHSSNNVSEFIRIINYSAEKPVIIVGDNVPKIVYVGMNIVIPNAESKSGISVIDTIVSLTVESKTGDIVIIDITDNAKYELEGIYTLVYYAEDACGQITMEKYEITCVKDTNKPTIQVDVGVTQLEVGQRLTIPVATAYDAEFGSVNVTMELIFNGKVISTDNSVILEETGLYTIRYTAKDGANNISIKEIDIIAVKGNNSGCSGNISSINVLMAALISSSILLIIKRKKYSR